MALPISRTITRGELSLTLPAPATATFTFPAKDHSHVRITIPAISTWSMSYHWHNQAWLCERIEFLTGGDWAIFRCKNVYRNHTTSGSWEFVAQLGPGERCGWGSDPHRDHPIGSPDLDVFVYSPGNEEMWRNIVSATLDADLWPALDSTPIVLRLLMRSLKVLPWIGEGIWKIIVGWVLWIQVLFIFYHHEHWLGLGEVPFCGWWAWSPWADMAPEWAQEAEWKSAEILSWFCMRTASVVGHNLLGLQDGYPEYYDTTLTIESKSKS